MTINKNSRDVINPNAKKLDQNDVLKTTSDEEESKPLDLSVKPAFDSALDLSFKLNEEAGSGADPRQNILDSSYACFNIPKPESSCISTSGHQEPCSVTQSKRVDLLTQHVSYSTESKIVPVTSTSSTDSKETIQLPPNQHSVPKLLESDIQSSPTAVSSLSTTLSTPNIFGSNTVARFVGPFSRRSVPPNVTVSRGLDPFPGKYVSANNTNNVSETVDTFLIKSQPTNNMNTATQAITSFPVPTIPLNNDISILTLPMHRTNSVLPHHCNSITKPLQPPMELPTIPQEARNKTQISNSVQQVSAVTMLPPGLPQQSPNQSGSLNSNISRTQFSPGVTTSVPSYCINTTRSAPSIPHSISHPTQRRLNNPNMTYPGRFAVSSDDQVRIPAGPGIPNSSSISEANHSCFVIEPADIQQVPVYQMSSCTETNVQSSVPIPGAFKTPDESRQQTALGSLPHTFTNQRVMHQQQCHQQHAQQQQQQQLLLQQQQQQRQRLHQLQELGQLNSMTSHSGALSERFQGLASVHAGSGPRQNISYNTAGTPVQQPGSSSSSSTANNILFCTQDGGALVCTIDEQDMRVVSINCDVCGSKAKFLCSNCKNVAYCSAKCQFNAWKSHRANCLVK
ncbi:hypothetical protein LSH36_14g08049 [Paralvinella palmiformis]|uniref:MYND-type domain-containing protein n=1 Tax=Paralvinella palmiformis TaxID=53620 RepID=A0AAD9KBT1_9ANNE|nr:hypothetical protein LSH36_14g08049 [Paralvinella palmiformis]